MHGERVDQPATNAADELRELIRAISQRAYGEPCYRDVEYLLWDAIGAGERSQIGEKIPEELKAKLRALSAECGGWVEFDAGGAWRFVPLAEWLERFENHGERIECPRCEGKGWKPDWLASAILALAGLFFVALLFGSVENEDMLAVMRRRDHVGRLYIVLSLFLFAAAVHNFWRRCRGCYGSGRTADAFDSTPRRS